MGTNQAIGRTLEKGIDILKNRSIIGKATARASAAVLKEKHHAGGTFVTAANKYIYKINLDTPAEIMDFAKIATKCPYEVYVVNGRHRLNAKSYVGVVLAKMSWDEMSVEADCDCYFEFEKYIV